jgi:phage shock protein A
MGLFQRIFKVGESHAHSLVDKLEDPIKMTEQGIRDLKSDLQKAMTSLAQVKAIAIRHKKDSEDQKKQAADYERKAMMLLQKMQGGDLDQAEAERLAAESLSKKEECIQRGQTLLGEHKQQQAMADQLQAKVEKLKQTITRYENELVTLRARARTAESTRKINQQLANVDSSSTIAMLEKMKNKVQEEESLAEAYGDIGEGGQSIDEEIDSVLSQPDTAKTSKSLDDLKKKMGIN